MLHQNNGACWECYQKCISQVGFLGTHNIVKSEIFGMTSFVLFLDVYNVNVVILIFF